MTKLNWSGRWTTRSALLASDLAALGLSFYLSYRLLPLYRPYLRAGAFAEGPFSAHAWLLLFVIPLWYLLREQAGLYSARRARGRLLLIKTARVQVLGLAVLSVLIFGLKLQAVSRLLIFGFCLLDVPVSAAARALALFWLEVHRSHFYNVLRVLVIGSRARAQEFIRQSRRSEEELYQMVGYLDPEPQTAPQEIDGVPLLGSTEILRQYLFAHPVDVVAFAMSPEQVPHARRLIDATMELGLRVVLVPDLHIHRLGFRFEQEAVAIEPWFGWPMAVLSNVRRQTTYLLQKRAIDIGVSALLLLLLAPLFAVIALLIKLTSPDGPVVYRWKVLGMNKKPFVSYKFRTMVSNAEELKIAYLKFNEMQGPVFKMKHDPRVTRLGRFLRKYSLDELPQLYSVLKGDMSLVGPRPPFPEEADRFEFWQRRKLSVKPGITCLWQVNGRNHIQTFDDWARLDLEYIQYASLWLDLKILLKTVPAVLSGRGAY